MEEENTFMLPPSAGHTHTEYEHVKHADVIYWVKSNAGNILGVQHASDMSIDDVRIAVEFWRSSHQIRQELTIHVSNDNGLKLCTFKIPPM